MLVAAYNQERYLGRCLRSLIAQSLDRDLFEIVVVDDGSSDATRHVIQSFIDEIRVVSLPENRGLPAALNAGLEAIAAPFTVRVDSDDYVNAEFLKILRLFLVENPAIDAIACDYLLVDDDEVVLGRCDALERPIACGIMFRTEHLHEIGRYDESFLMHEDLDLRHRFLQTRTIDRLPLPLYRYRRHDANMTNDVATGEEYLQRLAEKHGDEAGMR